MEQNNIENFNIFLKDLYDFQEKQSVSKLYLDLKKASILFPCFNDCYSLVDFVGKLYNIEVKELGINEDNGYIKNELLNISLLDINGQLRVEWKNYLFNDTGEEFLEKRFIKLMKLCNEIESNEGAQLAQVCYIFFRMEILIRNPVITIDEFRDKLALLLDRKFTKYKRAFLELFKEFYEKINYKGEYSLCLNCGYLVNDHNHKFCKSSKIKKKLLDSRNWVIKESVYKYYTEPGLIERDCYDLLIKYGFKVELYPKLEKDGDIKVIIGDNKCVYIDCKSFSNVIELVEELKGVKYEDRVIVIPNLYYKEHKEYIKVSELPLNTKRKVLNLNDMIKYLEKELKNHVFNK